MCQTSNKSQLEDLPRWWWWWWFTLGYVIEIRGGVVNWKGPIDLEGDLFLSLPPSFLLKCSNSCDRPPLIDSLHRDSSEIRYIVLRDRARDRRSIWDRVWAISRYCEMARLLESHLEVPIRFLKCVGEYDPWYKAHREPSLQQLFLHSYGDVATWNTIIIIGVAIC